MSNMSSCCVMLCCVAEMTSNVLSSLEIFSLLFNLITKPYIFWIQVFLVYQTQTSFPASLTHHKTHFNPSWRKQNIAHQNSVGFSFHDHLCFALNNRSVHWVKYKKNASASQAFSSAAWHPTLSPLTPHASPVNARRVLVLPLTSSLSSGWFVLFTVFWVVQSFLWTTLIF